MSSGSQRPRGGSSSSGNPKSKINHLLRELELEFDKILVENMNLRERIANLENHTLDQDSQDIQRGTVELTPSGKTPEEHETFDKNVLKSFTKNKAFKTRHKLKAHTSKIVSKCLKIIQKLTCTLKLCTAMWKFDNFSATQTTCEINFMRS